MTPMSVLSYTQSNIWSLVLGGLLALLTIAPLVQAGQSDNHGIHAVPVPGKVTIDGDLADWDLSGAVVICYDVASLLDIYSAKVAMMHDEQNLYVAIRWQDATPMGNSHDPQFQLDRGWAGDAVQLRLKTDRITHATAWCFAAKQEPVIKLDYGKSLTEPFGGGSKTLFRTKDWQLQDGAAMAFKANPDGKGYVQEIQLPWSLITKDQKPAVGGQFACGLELLWGEQDWPVHRYADNLAEGKTSREFFWTARDAWGPVFMEAKGNLTLPVPAWMQADAEEVAEGPIKVTYTLAKDSKVTLAIDDASGKRVRNLLAAASRKAGPHSELWDGMDDSGKLVAPGDYQVKGLSHDGLHLKYAGSFASPGDPPWSTGDNKGAYYGDHTPPEAVAFGPGERGAIACAMGEAGRHLIGVDLQGRRQWGLANRAAFGGGRISLATDGKLLWVANVDGRNGLFTIWRCDLRTGAYAPWQRTDEAGRQILDLLIRPQDGMAQCRAIAIKDGVLAVMLAGECKVLLLNSETGDQIHEWAELPAGLSGCAYRADGQLLLTAGSDLLVLDPATGKHQVLASGLVEPRGVAVGTDGKIFVSQRGAAMNVAVFSATGQPAGAIGQLGGRPGTGFFEPKGILNPSQIAVDAKGRLWVTESHQQPKRTSVWEPATGELVFDLIGTTAYAAGGVINPFDHTRGFSEEVEYRLQPGQPARPLFTLSDALGTGHGWVTRFARVDGREYLQIRSTARSSPMVKLYVRQADGAWRHCAEFGLAGRGKTPDDKSNRQWNQTFTGPRWEGRFGQSFCWVDRNDDGQAQREEIETIPGAFGACYWGQAMGEDLTVVIPQGNELVTVKPTGFTAAGAPLYSLATATRFGAAVGGEGMLMVGHDGRTYVNHNPLRALSTTGEVLWTYPNYFVSVHGSHPAC
jgi:sugar lactone lactonase YvrE